ncbi:hypothetical protein QF046_002465 [Microbacterium sp. W4I4]|uniref:hypothetical protein n=1 Tax=Microbacterium sp. W4I4 TaxID=3042295 RepID=UPI002788C1AA|nr:hypothetical protein [Microbacterium sp. W4I4]MDQ0614824.1 hypothetical protein [Microbacterium sp. W4I4]
MNTTDTNDNDNTTENSRPFGYWITAVDRLLRAELATVFDDEGITRREWRMLNRIDGTFAAPAASDRPLRARKLHRLLELGWVERSKEGWTLTEAGTLAKQRLGIAVDEIRARVAGAVSPEEYATMTASLEKIAREFGWAEGRRLPRREGRFGHRHPGGHRGFGHGFHGERFRHGFHGEHSGRGEDSGHGGRFRGFGPGEGSEPGEHPRGEGFGPGDRFRRGEGFGGRRFSHRGAPAHVHFHHHHG